ncbi:MAG TPA: NAD(P)H-quinone oxidoreductase [Thermoanaerobaculia bacterium]|nr:NAD(P)H-quinone oxidoreductase [Thermoanaerobaculia bacterium]
MRAVLTAGAGGPEVLGIGEVPAPEPGPGQLLVRVRAAALNQADLLQRNGEFPAPPGESDILGVEIAGDVAACGPDVELGVELPVGSAVCGLVGGGAYADYCLLDAEMAIAIPPGFSYAEMAAVPEVFFTADTAMFALGKLSAGQTVLVHGGGSGLGSACIQMAKSAGARVACTVGSDDKAARARALGADLSINYKTSAFVDDVLAWTEGAGADLVIDIVGAGYFERNLAVLKEGGCLVLVGVMSGTRGEIDLDPILLKRLRLKGTIMRSRPIEAKRAITRRFRERWLPLLAARELWPVVDSVFPIADVAQAHGRMERSEHFGKIILDVYHADDIPVPEGHGQRATGNESRGSSAKTTLFQQFNADLIDAAASSRERIERLLPEQDARMKREGGHRYLLLPLNFVFPEGDCARLGDAASALVEIQTKVLRHLHDTIGPERILRMFRVPAGMQRFVNWEELLEPGTLVSRFDILQAADGSYRFCEFNIDSCVGAAEIFEYAADYFSGLGVDVPRSLGVSPPLRDLGALLAQTAARRGITRIVIFDWSVGGGSGGKGYMSFERMRGHIAQAVHPIPVFIADEKTCDEAWLTPEEAPRTLFYRGFLMDEMDDGGAFLDRLQALGATVINTYESEIRMDKGWFVLLHDERIRQLLTPRERDLIDAYLPYTCDVDRHNAASLVERKARYVFKEKHSFGGKGIHFGDETPAEELTALFDQHPGAWTAQEVVPIAPTLFPVDADLRSEPQKVVFGLFVYGARVNGMLFRASTRSRIVNVTAGNARLAWAFSANERTKAELVNGLREASVVGL